MVIGKKIRTTASKTVMFDNNTITEIGVVAAEECGGKFGNATDMLCREALEARKAKAAAAKEALSE